MTTGPISSDQLAAQQAAAAEAARQAAAAEAARLAALEAARAQAAATEAQGTGQEAVYFDKAGTLDRDTIATNTAFGDAYDQFAGADGEMTLDEFETMHAQLAGADGQAGTLTNAEGEPITPEQKLAQIAALEEEAAEAQVRYDQAISQFGSALTPEQQRQFQAEFEAAHPAIGQLEAAKQDLAGYLAVNQAKLVAQAGQAPETKADPATGVVTTTDPAKEVLALYQALMPEQSAAAMGFIQQVLNDPQAIASGASARVMEELVIPNMKSFQADAIQAAGGDVEAAMKQLDAGLGGALRGFVEQAEALKGTYDGGKEKYDQLMEAVDNAKEIGGFLKDVNTALKGPDKLSELAKLARTAKEGADKAGEAGDKGGRGLGLALGAFALVAGLYAEGGTPQGEFELFAAAEDFTGTAKEATELLENFAEVTGKSERFIKNVGRVAGLLGAVESGIEARKSFADFQKEGDGHDLAIAIGHSMGVVSGLATFLGYAGVAGPIGAAGALVVLGAEISKQDWENKQARQLNLDLLQRLKPPFAKEDAEALAALNPYKMKQLEAQYGITPGQIAETLQPPTRNMALLTLPDPAMNPRFMAFAKGMFGDPMDSRAFLDWYNEQGQVGAKAGGPVNAAYTPANSANVLAQYFDQSDNRFLMIPFPRDKQDPTKVDQQALAAQIDKEIAWLRQEGQRRHGPGQTEVLIAQLEALKKRTILGPNEAS